MPSVPDEFSAAIERWNNLFKILSNEPIIKIRGVVSPSGTGGGSLGEFWVLSSRLEAWRLEDGILHTTGLAVCRKLDTKDNFLFYKNQIKPYSVIEIHGRIAIDPATQESICELTDNPALVADPELDRFAHHLQNPVTFRDASLGSFTLNRNANWFEAKVVWQKREIELTLQTADNDKLPQILVIAKELLSKQPAWAQKAKDYAVKELFEDKASDWWAEHGTRLTKKNFMSSMTLDSISIKEDGSFEFWYNDGDLYGGHYITLSGDFEHGMTEARVAG